MNRRGFLKIFGVGTASLAVPATAYAASTISKNKVIGPVLLERVCDGGRSHMTAEEWQRYNEDFPSHFRGCGTRFRWYLGTKCMCPTCMREYLYTFEQLKKKEFFVSIE
jgi:hypothetical protein